MRDLEKDYKELMNEQVPDLWARIEANLEPKKEIRQIEETNAEETNYGEEIINIEEKNDIETTTKKDKICKVAENKQNKVTDIEAFQGKKLHKMKYRYMTTTVAAALVILVGGYTFIHFSGNKNYSDNSAPAVMGEATFEMAAEDTQVDSMQNMVERPVGLQNIKGQANENNLEIDNQMDAEAEMAVTESTLSNTAKATIEILHIDQNMADEKASINAKVISGEDILGDRINEEIQINLHKDDLKQMEIGKQYQVKILCDKGQEGWIYTLDSLIEKADE